MLHNNSVKMLQYKKERLFYLIAFAVLCVTVTFIALFVHDSFVRPYLGDAIVVIEVYCFVRIFLPKKVRLLPLYVFLFAVAVELLQLADILSLLHLAQYEILHVLVGTVFSWWDIVCYAAGCALLGLWEVFRKYREENTGLKS